MSGVHRQQATEFTTTDIESKYGLQEVLQAYQGVVPAPPPPASGIINTTTKAPVPHISFKSSISHYKLCLTTIMRRSRKSRTFGTCRICHDYIHPFLLQHWSTSRPTLGGSSPSSCFVLWRHCTVYCGIV